MEDSWEEWLDKEAGTGCRVEIVAKEKGDNALVQNLIVNEGNYVGRRLSTNALVPGNPHKAEFREFWKEVIKPSSFVLETIENGYQLPFAQVPPASFEQNNKSARDDECFVTSEVLRLEKLGCISRVQTRPYIVLPLSSIFSKKKRVVVDASRALNPYLEHRRVKLQDHGDIPNVVKQGSHLSVDDLDSGYWHVKIHEEHRKYLGIHIIGEDGDPVFFVWNVLFLGVKDAVFIFTALLKPIRAHIVSLGIPCLVYLDDILTMGSSEEAGRRNRNLAVSVLAQAGWVVSEEKAKGPKERLQFLGLEVCSREMAFFIPEKKILKILESLQEILSGRRVRLRSLASFLGFLQSCARALGPVVRMMTRVSYNWVIQKVSGASYEAHFSLPEEVRNELQFWRDNVRSLNGFKFSPVLSIASETRLTVVTDSSASGCFGFQFNDKYRILLRRAFTTEECEVPP